MTADPTYSRRWLILAIVGVAQVMVVLDTTVVRIALPTAQQALRGACPERNRVAVNGGTRHDRHRRRRSGLRSCRTRGVVEPSEARP